MTALMSVATKEPIISTFDANMLHTSPSEVQENYRWHAATYVEQEILQDLRSRFTQAILDKRTPKACIVAPFGYGKTASAVGIWAEVQEMGILALPPIACKSFVELAQSILDWMCFILPEQTSEIRDAYEQFLSSSTELLARRDEREFGIPYEQARAAIQDKLERGYLDFEDVSVNLIGFLEKATSIAVVSGYRGLVLIVDELQQLMGNMNKGVLVAFRQLIWGLRTRPIAFGLLLTMDPDTERTIADRAGDILHRIKDDGLYLDIRQIYNREFPARLWSRFIAALPFAPGDQEAIDRPALDALGQLCERDDLSNGPRTVINALQAATVRWTNSAKPYTPIALVDDLLDGTIRFDGDRNIIPALVGELLNYPYFEQSPTRAAVLKLIAAFPRGCDIEVARRYGLGDAWQELNDDLRGELLTEIEEGLTLIELQRVGRPANRLNLLLRRYWLQITDHQLLGETALKTVATTIVPSLFPQRTQALNGWSELQSMRLTATGAYIGVMEGTSSPSFPLRKILVAVAHPHTEIEVQNGDDIDLYLTLRVDPAQDTVPLVQQADKNEIIVQLALHRITENGLGVGLNWIEHYLSPQPISPAIVLSLLHYLDREPLDTLSDRDQKRIADTIARLEEWVLAELFPPSAFAATGFKTNYAGQSGFREFLYLLLQKSFPHYKPLARFQHWTSLLEDYHAALQQVDPDVRLGRRPISATKVEIAALFRQTRHAGFSSSFSTLSAGLAMTRKYGFSYIQPNSHSSMLSDK